MNNILRILKKVFFLPPLPTVLIAIPCFTFCFCILASEQGGVISYISYALSAYALTITVTGMKRITAAIKKGIHHNTVIKKAKGIPLVEKITKDIKFRTKVSLYFGFAVNLLYIAIKIFSGIYFRSAWFAILAVYYILLALMRFVLLRYIRKNTVGTDIRSELHKYRFCGTVLLIMNLVLAGMVMFITYQNQGYEYPGMLIYAIAAYTFYITTTAVINIVKFRNYRSPVLSAAKAVNLVAAAVSMLSLTTAMLSSFGGQNEDPNFRQLMTGLTGGGVCIIVLGLAIFMIVRSTKLLNTMLTGGK